MKKFFARLGFRKMDEMEQYIAFKAQRNAYLFLILALLGWTLYESWRVFTLNTRLNLIPCMLLMGASLIQNVSQLSMNRKAGTDEEEGPDPVWGRVALAALIIAAVLVAVGAVLVFWRVRV